MNMMIMKDRLFAYYASVLKGETKWNKRKEKEKEEEEDFKDWTVGRRSWF